MTAAQISALRTTLESTHKSNSVLRETHISWVILVDELAYKIKKPVKLSFLDFTDAAERARICRRELTLNRRLAAQIYLRVEAVKQSGTDINIGGTGDVIDHALVMRRMDDSLLLSSLLQQGALTKMPTYASTGAITDTARQIALFHSTAERIFTQDVGERMNRAIDNILQVRDTIELELGAAGAQIADQCSVDGRHFVAQNIDYLQERATRGFIRDCHGDLHTGNIIMTDPPIIFDCIEFNDEYRQIDILSEIAFLSMDLEAHKRKDLSLHFLQCYLHFSQLPHGHMEHRLLTYFKLYRANVRAKVAAIALQNMAQDEQNEAERHSRRTELHNYLQLVDSYRQQLVNSSNDS